MKKTVIQIVAILVLIAILGTFSYYTLKELKGEDEGVTTQTGQSVTVISAQNSDGTYSLDLDNSKWNYDETNNVYYQIGVVYCASPETTDYETLGIYVPGDYFTSTKNGDGTYTCTLNNDKTVGGYNVETAPIVMPINTAGYSAQQAPTSYSYNGLSSYLEAGYIYVYAGCRGRYDSITSYSSGAPWGVTDLKAAIRYLKYNKDSLPGDTERIFTFGHSGGGAQSAIVGAAGDSNLYTAYLESIGAAMTDKNGNTISDSICGAMCWCPITNLDYADAAYEWNMGQYASTGTRASGTFTKELSNDLAKAYASYINSLGLKDENGNNLTLSESSSGIYTAGSYYNYLLSTIETSLNNFLKDTTFPYTPSSATMLDGGFGGGAPGGKQGSTSSSSTTYNTAKEYIASLNSDTQWITYNENTNTAKIKSVAAFVQHCKNASKDVGAFDSLNRSQAENKVFGNDTTTALHFDQTMAKILKENSSKYANYSDWDSSYVEDYTNDLTNTDKLGNDVAYRRNMYNPMYYLSSYYEGNGTSKVAKYWRINTGIEQGDTANTTEINLALALKQNKNVKSVDFTTVWGQGHTTAERSGDSTTNFIKWVNRCLAE